MTPNIAAALFNTFVAVFFMIAAVGVGLLAYAAITLKKNEGERLE